MKSIVEEASSVMKAIEKGWQQAGKPQEFSIKVYEVEQKNFLGLTTKSAKVAIFFGEKLPASKQDRPHKEYERKERKEEHAPRTARPARTERPTASKQIEKNNELSAPAKPKTERREFTKEQRIVWTPELIDAVTSWLKQTLQRMNLADADFTVNSKNYYLKIAFNKPLLSDPEQERFVFRSLAHLTMQSLRNNFKKGFRGYKVILQSGKLS